MRSSTNQISGGGKNPRSKYVGKFLWVSKIFSTITATENRDFIALEQVNGVEPDQYKKDFINKIYKPQKFRLLTGRETARLQGFPDKFKIHANDKTAKKHFGNAVPAKVVESVFNMHNVFYFSI
mgnify:CR=1 FL=1